MYHPRYTHLASGQRRERTDAQARPQIRRLAPSAAAEPKPRHAANETRQPGWSPPWEAPRPPQAAEPSPVADPSPRIEQHIGSLIVASMIVMTLIILWTL
jgi:hypothetical protein